MKTVVSFSLFLVAGILGTTIAQESRAIENDKLEKIQGIKNYLDLVSDFQYFGDLPDIMNTFNRLKCRLNGGPNADTDVIESLGIFINSVIALNNVTQQQLDDIADDQHIGVDAVIETTCNWATTIYSSVRIFTNSFKQCLDSSERISVDLINDVSSALLQYVCKDNGMRVSAFLAADGENCIESSAPGIDNCMSGAFSENNTIIKRSDSPVTPLWNVPVITLNSQFCREFQNAQECNVKVLQGCENPTTSYAANALFNIVKRTLGCEDLLKM